jgi:hypothetical protein
MSTTDPAAWSAIPATYRPQPPATIPADPQHTNPGRISHVDRDSRRASWSCTVGAGPYRWERVFITKRVLAACRSPGPTTERHTAYQVIRWPAGSPVARLRPPGLNTTDDPWLVRVAWVRPLTTSHPTTYADAESTPAWGLTTDGRRPPGGRVTRVTERLPDSRMLCLNVCFPSARRSSSLSTTCSVRRANERATDG